jgi:SAM-dependent methyltransferase
VEYPHRALEEIHRVLQPDGIVVISSVMNFPIHDYPCDYWRFTPEAFRSILKPFAGCFVGFAGKEDFPHTVVGVGFKGAIPDLSEFNRRYAEWQGAQARIGALPRAIKALVPPVLMPVLLRMRRSIMSLITGR